MVLGQFDLICGWVVRAFIIIIHQFRLYLFLLFAVVVYLLPFIWSRLVRCFCVPIVFACSGCGDDKMFAINLIAIARVTRVRV